MLIELYISICYKSINSNYCKFLKDEYHNINGCTTLTESISILYLFHIPIVKVLYHPWMYVRMLDLHRFPSYIVNARFLYIL